MKTFLILFMAVLFFSAPMSAQDEIPVDAKAKQAYALGVTAYLWGYPMDKQKKLQV